MRHCLDPYPLYNAGSDRSYNATLNRVDGTSVRCGRCDACVANRKQDWTGKCMGEALTSGSVSFVTLTYAKDPEGLFVYEDVQNYLKRLRIWLWRKAGRNSVRYFAVGENGSLNGRVHWHLVLFFRKPQRHPVPQMNEKSPFWDHGWCNVQNLSPAQVAQKIRYVVKYAVKDMDGNGNKPKCSLKPALGHEYLMRHAHDTAKAGLCPNGRYQLPGMVWAKGHRAGMSQDFTIRGSQIRHYIARYRDAWAAWQGERRLIRGPWLQKYDDEALDPSIEKRGPPPKRHVYAREKPRFVVSPMRPGGSEEGKTVSMYLCGEGGGWACELRVVTQGPMAGWAYIWADDYAYDIEESVREVLELDRMTILRLDKWLWLQRGPHWGVNNGKVEAEQKAKAEAQRKRERRASRQAWLDAEDARKRAEASRIAAIRAARAEAAYGGYRVKRPDSLGSS